MADEKTTENKKRVTNKLLKNRLKTATKLIRKSVKIGICKVRIIGDWYFMTNNYFGKLATNHDGFDYEIIVQSSEIIIDTRGDCADGYPNVVRA